MVDNSTKYLDMMQLILILREENICRKMQHGDRETERDNNNVQYINSLRTTCQQKQDIRSCQQQER